MKLYDAGASGNCHKVRLFLSILGLDYEAVPVNLAEGEQNTPEYLAMNPLHQVPVLDDAGFVLRDSQAILVYLARREGKDDWLPTDAKAMGEVMQWMIFSGNEMLHGCAVSRALIKFGREGDIPLAQSRANAALAVLDGRLDKSDWLAFDRPTIADIANYPYAGMVWEGQVSLDPYPNVRAWLERVEALDGWVGMPGLAGIPV